MFLSALLSFLLYTLVFLRMRGNIVVNGLYVRFRVAENEDWRGRLFAQNYALRIAKKMLLYVPFPPADFNWLNSRVQVPGMDATPTSRKSDRLGSIDLGVYRLPTQSLSFQSQLLAFASGRERMFHLQRRPSRMYHP